MCPVFKDYSFGLFKQASQIQGSSKTTHPSYKRRRLDASLSWFNLTGLEMRRTSGNGPSHVTNVYRNCFSGVDGLFAGLGLEG